MIFADPRHWPKMRIVHCGVDPARYDTARQTPGKGLLFVGRLAAVKGVAVLLEAFARVLEAHPDARLTLVGDGGERAGLETSARALGCGGAVRFAGYLSQDEVAAELAAADLFVLPWFAEGVPVVLMEAMASRLPVVATRIAVPSWSRMARTAYWCPRAMLRRWRLRSTSCPTRSSGPGWARRAGPRWRPISRRPPRRPGSTR